MGDDSDDAGQLDKGGDAGMRIDSPDVDQALEEVWVLDSLQLDAVRFAGISDSRISLSEQDMGLQSNAWREEEGGVRQVGAWVGACRAGRKLNDRLHDCRRARYISTRLLEIIDLLVKAAIP